MRSWCLVGNFILLCDCCVFSGITDTFVAGDPQARSDGGDLEFEDPSGYSGEWETGDGRSTQTFSGTCYI